MIERIMIKNRYFKLYKNRLGLVLKRGVSTLTVPSFFSPKIFLRTIRALLSSKIVKIQTKNFKEKF